MHRKLAIVFTGDEFADGGSFIAQTLHQQKVKASFFLTGRFYRNPLFRKTILQLKKDGHYLGAHSDQHLLYCDWAKRDSLLVDKKQFTNDLLENYRAMKQLGIERREAKFFLPPFEWYNDTIGSWTKDLGLQLINYTPGTISHADYTIPDQNNYRSSQTIYQSISDYEERYPGSLNGFILLMHIGTDPKRTDKFYERLPELIHSLKQKNYRLVTVNRLLGE
jgi:endoglucanase